MEILLYIIISMQLCYCEGIATRHKLTRLQQDLSFLRDLTIGLRHDVDDLYSWRNASFIDQPEHDSERMSEDIDVTETNNHNVTVTHLERVVGSMESRVDYIVRGLQGEKLALRSMIHDISNEVQNAVADIQKLENSLIATDVKVRAVSESNNKSHESAFTNLTATLGTMEGRLENDFTELKKSHVQCQKELEATKNSNKQLDEKVQHFNNLTNGNIDDIRYQLVTLSRHLYDFLKGGWLLHTKFMYKLFEKKSTFSNAVSQCKEHGAYLVEVSNEDENTFLYQKFGKERFTIGATDESTQGQFKWLSGKELTYKKWFPGEPNGGMREDCLEMGGDTLRSMWNDYPCRYERNFVCKKTCGTLCDSG